MKSLLSPVSLLVTVTVAPGTTAPAAVTVPRISPVFLLCENADPASHSTKVNASVQRMKHVMEFLPSKKSIPSPSDGTLEYLPARNANSSRTLTSTGAQETGRAKLFSRPSQQPSCRRGISLFY